MSLPALIVSTMAPDLGIPFTYLITRGTYNRLFLHSFLGAATIGTFLSVLLTIFVYPSVVSFIFKLDKEKVQEKCRFSGSLVALCLIGTISHVLLDSMTHNFNPLLYPFVEGSVDIFRFTKDLLVAGAVVYSVLLAPLIYVFVDEVRKGSQDFWMQMLVG